MIRIENYVKTYGKVRALDGLSLEVEPGVVYGFLGPNGAGKTTTMRLLSSLAKPTSGRAWIEGEEVGSPGTDTRRLIGVMPEEPAFYTWMTPREYLRDFIAPMHHLEPIAAAKRADEILEMVDLKRVANRRIAGFSRGMRQRLGLAQALIHSPKVLLLDEPVSALDPAGRKEVLELIENLQGSATVLLSTHILADVERVCKVIGIINKGKLVLQENSEQLLLRYALPLFEIEIDRGLEDWVNQVKMLPFVDSITVEHNTARVLVKNIQEAQRELLTSLATNGTLVRRFEVVHPSLEEIFLRLTES